MSNKMKTHKAIKKRFRLSASGKAKHRPAGTSHRQVRMSQKRKRNLRRVTTVDQGAWEATIRQVLGKHSS